MDSGRHGRQADDEALWGSIRADGVSRDARLVELTLHGGAIETTMAVRAHDEVRLMFATPGGEPIVVDGIVRYVDDDRIGVEFVRMSDAARARFRALLRSEFERRD